MPKGAAYAPADLYGCLQDHRVSVQQASRPDRGCEFSTRMPRAGGTDVEHVEHGSRQRGRYCTFRIRSLSSTIRAAGVRWAMSPTAAAMSMLMARVPSRRSPT